MNSIPQRWLSLSGICTTLNLRPNQVKLLYKQNLLVRIGKRPEEHRYLDPTPEYAERLRLAAVMLSKNPIVPDLPSTFILTVREVAEIMGWSLRYARTVMAEKKVPFFKAKNKACLYSVEDVRDLIFKRNGRGRFSKQLSPFLLPEIIAYQRRFQSEEESIVPTDAAFERDEELQKKIRWMMKQPNREVLLADFIGKVELAKQVVQTLKSA
jgi:hypothetical protein